MSREVVSSYEAKTKLPALLRRAERGETIAITRHGVEIAQLGPSRAQRAAHIRAAFKRLRNRRGVKGRMTTDEIVAAIREGREDTAGARWLRDKWARDDAKAKRGKGRPTPSAR